MNVFLFISSVSIFQVFFFFYSKLTYTTTSTFRPDRTHIIGLRTRSLIQSVLAIRRLRAIYTRAYVVIDHDRPQIRRIIDYTARVHVKKFTGIDVFSHARFDYDRTTRGVRNERLSDSRYRFGAKIMFFQCPPQSTAKWGSGRSVHRSGRSEIKISAIITKSIPAKTNRSRVHIYGRPYSGEISKSNRQ